MNGLLPIHLLGNWMNLEFDFELKKLCTTWVLLYLAGVDAPRIISIGDLIAHGRDSCVMISIFLHPCLIIGGVDALFFSENIRKFKTNFEQLSYFWLESMQYIGG
jgi:hypothetical protein